MKANDSWTNINENHDADTSVNCPICKKDHSIEHLEVEYKHCVKGSWRVGAGDTMCTGCGKSFTGNYSKKHLNMHIKFACPEGPKEKLWCDKCGKGFASKLAIRDHIRTAHENFVFQCEFCPKTFKSRHTWHDHRNKVHSTDNKYQCEVCGLKMGSLTHKKTHERTHQEPQFQCSFCEKKLKTPKAKIFHERQHTGEKPFKCPHCENAFASLHGLTQHKKGVHRIEGPQGGAVGWSASKKKSKNMGQLLPPS